MAQKPDDLQGAFLARYVQNRWGTKTRLVPRVNVFVSTADVTVLAKANPKRMELIVTNVGDSPVYVDWYKKPTPGFGIIIPPGGGELVLLADEDGELVGYEMGGVASPNGSQCFAWEVEGE